MARRVYFAFDYEDVKDFRANVVRMSWVTQPNTHQPISLEDKFGRRLMGVEAA